MENQRLVQLQQNLEAMKARIDSARAENGRHDPVRLVVVTKTFPASDCQLLASMGVQDMGENRVNEAAEKSQVLAEKPIRWHMMGQIQSNKTASIARWAHTVHSVNKEKQVTGLARARQRFIDEGLLQDPLDVLVQLSIDGDTARGGIVAADVPELADKVQEHSSLRLRGVMVVPPLGSCAQESFERGYDVFSSLHQAYDSVTIYSAGMSGDYREAIAAGSHLVRVGSAILGSR